MMQLEKKTGNSLTDIPDVEAIDFSKASESMRLDLPSVNSDYILTLTIGRGVTEQGHRIQANRQLPV